MVRRHPGQDRGEWVFGQPVYAALAVDRNVDAACVPQHTKVLGDQRLRNVQPLNKTADIGGPIAQGVEDAPPGGVGDHRECVHAFHITIKTYNCQAIC